MLSNQKRFLNNAKTCYRTRKRAILIKNVFTNIEMCYPQRNIILYKYCNPTRNRVIERQKGVIQPKIFLSNAKTCYPIRKYVIQQ